MADRVPAQMGQRGAEVATLVAAADTVGVEEDEPAVLGADDLSGPEAPVPEDLGGVGGRAGREQVEDRGDPVGRPGVADAGRRHHRRQRGDLVGGGPAACGDLALSVEVGQPAAEVVREAEPPGQGLGRLGQDGRDRSPVDGLPDGRLQLGPDRDECRDQRGPVVRGGEGLLDPGRLGEPVRCEHLGVEAGPGRSRPDAVAQHAPRARAVADRLDQAAEHRFVEPGLQQGRDVLGRGGAGQARQRDVVPEVPPPPRVDRHVDGHERAGPDRRPEPYDEPAPLTGAPHEVVQLPGRCGPARRQGVGQQPQGRVEVGEHAHRGGVEGGGPGHQAPRAARRVSTASRVRVRTWVHQRASWTGQRRAVSFSWNSAAYRRARAHRASSQPP